MGVIEHCDAGSTDRLDIVSTASKADPATPAGSASPLSARRPLGDRSFQILALASGLLVLVILVLIAVSTSQQASSWFCTEGCKIFTNDWDPANNKFGALAFIYGTAITAVIAIIIAVPVSVGIALLLNEVVPYRWSRPIVYVIDLLAVVPSVVWGLWGILVFAPWIQHIYASIALGRQRHPGARPLVRTADQRGLVLHRRHHPGLHDHADRDLAVA